MKCQRVSAIGTPCDLDEGHDGDHQKTYPEYRTVTWNDDADRRFLAGESSRKQGT